MCREHGFAVIARVPFDEGSLTGTMTRDMRFPKDDWRSLYFTPENLGETMDHVDALRKDVPTAHRCPTSRCASSSRARDVTTVIPGMRRIRHVEGNLAASDAPPLDGGLMTKLRRHRWVRTHVIP
jgi:aryl-alcohol dehydrogenase-like predicted oxidoreductase